MPVVTITTLFICLLQPSYCDSILIFVFLRCETLPHGVGVGVWCDSSSRLFFFSLLNHFSCERMGMATMATVRFKTS
ncbi:uncharacterized protein N7479_004647 [Penicillium vulpinum]|uniref:uncharacterized protein n=1 Tax=Penicillium vulpinum TaxID=29845 RepID=UPI0025482E3D|nr:uncharacterized protein N7479_004647 [Penicillium vulpinum]KAJ5964771.1 hypothetical protein N7479_004647 [Penicillium vulpinum]